MILLVKILVITSLYLPNNENVYSHFDYYNTNFFFIDFITNSTEESITESFIPFFNQKTKQENNNDLKFYKSCTTNNRFINSIQSSFLYRLLPFLIDQPPPVYHRC